ncbi:hypothetical protein OIO90_005861 [Microbotryomycetes sp. JL221]|nr:hypothetical protein OIO90_005861 [Microbotryomycetes sp. JL221]
MSSTNSPQEDRQLTQPAKRGARACVSCRKGKNKCVNDGNAPCQRCRQADIPCVFEAPASHKAFDEERVERIEKSIQALTGTVQTLVSTLSSGSRMPGSNDLAAPPLLSMGSAASSISAPLRLDPSFNARSPANPMTWDLEMPGNGIAPLLAQHHVYQPQLPPTIPQDLSSSFGSNLLPDLPSRTSTKRAREPKLNLEPELPPLPNYKAPPHPVSMYGIIPSTAPSSDDEDDLPTASLTAPLEALAQAASEAHVEMNPATSQLGHNGGDTNNRARKRRKPVPPPKNFFPSVTRRGQVTDACARKIYDFFMTTCLPFWPILDPIFDTYESLQERSPWTINAIVMVGATRLAHESPEFRQAAEHGLEEAHGIARSSLFGPTVRFEGVQAMGIVAAWQTGNSPYMAAGHGLRMAMELGLHRALEKLKEDAAEGRVRAATEQRSLIASARIFLCLYWLDWVLSTAFSTRGSRFVGEASDLATDARELAVSARSSAHAVLELCDDDQYRSALRCAPYEVFVDISFACLLLLKLTRLFHDGVDLEQVAARADRLQASFYEYPGAQRFSMTIKIALDRFVRSFKLSLAARENLTSDPMTAPALASGLSSVVPATFGFPSIGALPFDVSTLPDSSWVGSDLFPEWIKGEAEDQDWTFDTAWTDGIDRLFLPQWSTGVVDKTVVEW